MYFFMEEISFTEKISDFDGVYKKVENIFDEIMKIYSLSEEIEINEFYDYEKNPVLAKYLIYNCEDLLKVSYSDDPLDNKYLVLDLQLFGNNFTKLEEIKSEIVKGLEYLL